MNYELSAAVTTGIICEPAASQVAVIPAEAGIQIVVGSFPKVAEWIPAFAVMTAFGEDRIPNDTKHTAVRAPGRSAQSPAPAIHYLPFTILNSAWANAVSRLEAL